jgi:hypothetical protein
MDALPVTLSPLSPCPNSAGMSAHSKQRELGFQCGGGKREQRSPLETAWQERPTLVTVTWAWVHWAKYSCFPHSSAGCFPNLGAEEDTRPEA